MVAILETPARGETSVDLGRKLRSVVFGLTLLGGWLVVFTIGSQLPSDGQTNPVMKLLTRQVPSLVVLGMLASCLGMWRRRYLEPSDALGGPEAYVSAAISGFVCVTVVQIFPSLFAGIFNFSRDQSTYNSFALAGSFIAFLSGTDRNFFDQLTRWVVAKWGLGERARASKDGPQAT